MQERLDKIESLISQGYKLKKKELKDNPFFKFFDIEIEHEEPFVSLKNSSGRSVNIYQKGQAGFSWIAFFFTPYLMVRIRNYSYFYWYALVVTLVSIFQVQTNSNTPLTLLQVIIGIIFAYQYPYLRYIAKSKNIKERGWMASICLGLILSILAIIPNEILTLSVSG
jgi:hypothetical protein